MMDRFESMWRRTKNPIWVWQAIGGGAVGAGKRPPPFPIPLWCAGYLYSESVSNLNRNERYVVAGA